MFTSIGIFKRSGIFSMAENLNKILLICRPFRAARYFGRVVERAGGNAKRGGWEEGGNLKKPRMVRKLQTTPLIPVSILDFLCLFSIFEMKLRKVRWAVGEEAVMLLGNILVSSVFYDRTRAPLKDIGNLQAASNIGGAVISRPQSLRPPHTPFIYYIPTPSTLNLIPRLLPIQRRTLQPLSETSALEPLTISHYSILPSFL